MLRIFAHDKNMRNSVLRREMVVTLPVKVDVVQPQYLHAGDKYVLNASVSSTSELPVAGVTKLEVYASDSYEAVEPVFAIAGFTSSLQYQKFSSVLCFTTKSGPAACWYIQPIKRVSFNSPE